MLTNAATGRGHGLDAAKDLGEDRFYGQKGGALATNLRRLGPCYREH